LATPTSIRSPWPLATAKRRLNHGAESADAKAGRAYASSILASCGC
jgi:hypothetical protein